MLDMAQIRYLLSEHLDLYARNVHAHVIGEHGDSEVAVWSLANAVGIELDAHCRQAGCELNERMR